MLTDSDLDFIKNNENEDVNKLYLKYKNDYNKNYPFLIQQIESKQKARNKLPNLTKNNRFIFPPSINLSQSSSELTAVYKSSKFSFGENFLDGTGGFGIDSIFFSKKYKNIEVVEKNKELKTITEYNIKNVLNIQNINIHNDTFENYLQNTVKKFDLIYVDPSRRDESRKKIINILEYSPNVIDLLELIFEKTNKILIKTSPMLDINFTLNVLKFCAEIHCISVKNDLKEVLYLVDKKENTNIVKFFTTNIEQYQCEVFNFSKNDKNDVKYTNSVQKFIYEPNASIMKCGGYKYIQNDFPFLHKIHPNSHFFTSNVLETDFPGRIFFVEKQLTNLKKEIKNIKKANIISRNYPLSAESIYEKFKIIRGGDVFLMATTLLNEKKIMMICSRLK